MWFDYGVAMHLSTLMDSPGENLIVDFVKSGSCAPMLWMKPYFVKNFKMSVTALRGCPEMLAKSLTE
jgi:hypothetical protein